MPTSSDFQSPIALVDIAIANGQTTSSAVNLNGTSLCGIFMSSSFTGANVTFQAAQTLGGTYQTIQKSGSDFSVTVTQGKYISLNPVDFAGVQYLKIVSGSAEGGARTLTAATRPI